MSLQGQCPSCGAAVTFKVSTSLVTVCEYCRSVVGRGDRGLESLGKVADVSDTGSPLDLWMKGRYRGVPFDLTGRVQYDHPAGGTWDEWYAHFADGRWGWLAEAQGRFYLTFEQPAQALPAFADLRLGQTVRAGPEGVELQVTEKNRARAAGARGEIPFRLEPGRDHPFADLYGPGRAFATFDYSEEPPLVFLGREVTLDELGVPAGARAGRREPRQVEALQLNCPNCGAALALRAPDQAERVGCPSCGSVLDVKEGRLSLLQSLRAPRIQPLLALGATGEVDGTKFTVLGFLQRSTQIEGETYYWTEYLLYEPRAGYRWLVHSDNHWTFVRPLPPGEVTAADQTGGRVAYAGKSFALFQRSRGTVEFVVGEFYWKVRAGESVVMQDFVAPPEMLSQEVTQDEDCGEINWSHGVYRTPDEVERAFGVAGLPAPVGVGPNQPFPYTPVYRRFLGLLGAAVVLLLLVRLVTPYRKPFERTFRLEPPPTGAEVRHVVTDQEPFELRAHRNVRLTLRTPSPGWVFVEGELAPGAAPRRTGFTLLAEPGGEGRVYLSAPPAGDYVLDLKFRWADPKQPAQATLTVEQGVVHPLPFVVLLLALGAVPFGVGIYQMIFESRRWQNSALAVPDPLRPRVRRRVPSAARRPSGAGQRDPVRDFREDRSDE